MGNRCERLLAGVENPPLERFPATVALLLSGFVGLLYFMPQMLYFARTKSPEVLFEENFEETSFLVLAGSVGAGRPDPYRVGAAAPGASSYSAQPVPPAAMAGLARFFHVPLPVVFWAGSFVFPALIALLLATIGWLCGVSDRATLGLLVCLPLLVLPPPYWHVLARYAADVLTGRTPEMLLSLPYSRRFQPQFSAVVHYLALAASLALVQLAGVRRAAAAAVLAGLAFGASFYCYFFSWSLLLLWFVTGAAGVWLWRRQRLRLWGAAAALGLVVSIPYWILALTHFQELGASGATAYTHRVSPALHTDLAVLAAVAAALALALWRTRWNRLLLGVPLALILTALAAVLQNVVTGIHVQPWHYLHFFGRPAASLGVAALLAGALAARPPLFGKLAAALVAAAVFFAGVVQWHRFRVRLPGAERVIEAMPAMEFLKAETPPGAVAFAPLSEVQEAIPAYTAAVPLFSIHMWMWRNEGDAHRDALLERIAASHALAGMSSEDFARRVRSRPWDIFYQFQLSSLDPRREGQMQHMERVVLQQFDEIARGERRGAFGGLRYLLLPAATPLESTRAPAFFDCRKLWSDSRYTVFELQPRPAG